MKNQLTRLCALLLISGALLLPMNVQAAEGMLAAVPAESGTIGIIAPCATVTQTATGALATTAVSVDEGENQGCNDMTTPAGVSWNSGGG